MKQNIVESGRRDIEIAKLLITAARLNGWWRCAKFLLARTSIFISAKDAPKKKCRSRNVLKT